MNNKVFVDVTYEQDQYHFIFPTCKNKLTISYTLTPDYAIKHPLASAAAPLLLIPSPASDCRLFSR